MSFQPEPKTINPKLFLLSWHKHLLVTLNYIAHFNIVEVKNSQTAFIAGSNFFNVIFETLERSQLTGESNNTVTYDAYFSVTGNFSVLYHTSCNSAALCDFKYFAHFNIADNFLFILRSQHSGYSILHFINGIV